MRRRYIQHPETLELIPAEEYESPRTAGFFVMGDIQPYRSMVTGEVIQGRRQHREHLKAHNVIELGNEKITPKPVTPPKGLKEQVIRAAKQHLQ